MNNFNKYEVWEDYWCFKPSTKIDLSTLEKINYFSWYKDKTMYSQKPSAEALGLRLHQPDVQLETLRKL